MNKTSLTIFSFILILFTISISSALCLNCNQLNSQVKYYQDVNGCSAYSPSVEYQVYNIHPIYSINQPYITNPIVQYYQAYLHHDSYTLSNSDSEPSKCNWHMLFYRNC